MREEQSLATLERVHQKETVIQLPILFSFIIVSSIFILLSVHYKDFDFISQT